jgi:enoyl-CoA hydratase
MRSSVFTRIISCLPEKFELKTHSTKFLKLSRGKEIIAKEGAMDFQNIETENREGVAVLYLNRPELRNAISVAMRKEISACLSRWKEDRGVGVVVLTGRGKAFTAGFDLREFRDPALFDEIFQTSARYHRDVWYFPKPVIAAVNGPALAGGFDLAKLCDIRIGSTAAVFGHPEIKFGVPTLFTPLRWIVGEGVARDLCLTGRQIGAEEALRIGLLNEVVEEEALLSAAVACGKRLLEAPLETLVATKRFILDAGTRGWEEAFRVEHDETFEKVIKKTIRGAVRKKEE